MDSRQSCLPCRRRINHRHEERGREGARLYIDSFIPPDRLEAAYVHENIARVRKAAALRHQGRSENCESRRIQLQF